MATTDSIPEVTGSDARHGAGLLVVLTAIPLEQVQSVVGKLTGSLPAEDLIIAAPGTILKEEYPSLRIVPTAATNASWMIPASEFVSAYELAEKNQAGAILMLGAECDSLSSQALSELANAARAPQSDLTVPRYDLGAHAGLISSGILYPLARGLFASSVRFPLTLDLGLSLRMAERLAGAARRLTGPTQGEALLWPVNEARVAGFAISQVDAGPRAQPHVTGVDLNAILPLVAGSLFSDIDAKAAFWQRSRQLPPLSTPIPTPESATQTPSADVTAEIAPMLQAFQLAYSNLQEIWRLVLPPSSLLGLKRLSATGGAEFRMPDRLWARIVYDFLLAHRLRTINRGHLLGALIPLYHAWVASHFNVVASGTDPEEHIEAVAAAFEADKAYIVSRWRWPDRFNP